MTKELIEDLRIFGREQFHIAHTALLSKAADAIERLELEAVAAELRMENDALEIAEYKEKYGDTYAALDDCARQHAKLLDERDALKADIEVLLSHIDTMQKCSNDPAIFNLAGVVLERFAVKKEGVK